MPSPFPGMDPYLEISGDWRDFHTRFLSDCADALSERLPDGYIARIEEKFTILEYPRDTGKHRFPDVSITRTRPTRSSSEPAAVAATLEPESIELVTAIVEEVTERWIEIRRRPDWVPVTTIELLSPSNKYGYSREEYVYKRLSLIAPPLHLVELDFLLGGNRLPMARPLPRGDYFAFVSRTERRPRSDVYAWSLRDPLPTIPIPLLSPDPDIPLDLAAIFARVYQRGRYEQSIDYGEPLVLPLNAEDRAWAEERARSGEPRSAG